MFKERAAHRRSRKGVERLCVRRRGRTMKEREGYKIKMSEDRKGGVRNKKRKILTIFVSFLLKKKTKSHHKQLIHPCTTLQN